MADEEWDTGAEISEGPQDKFNKFDPFAAVGGPPPSEIVKGAEKPVVDVEEKFAHLKTAATTVKPVMTASSSGGGGNMKVGKVNLPTVPQVSVPVVAASAAPVYETPPLPPMKAAPAIINAQAMEVSQPRTFSTRVDQPASGAASFTAKLSPEALRYFNDLTQKPFSAQIVAFLNAYWSEVGSQAEYIFSCLYEKLKYADMHAKGIIYQHLYDEGCDLDFNIGLYFYEKLCQEVLESENGKKWRNDPKYKPSMPEMMTALVRKQELREKVDVNFDGRVSALEVLLYQYRAYANPGDFTQRSMAQTSMGENEAIMKARLALEEVNKAIRAYETEKSRLESESKEPGVKGLAAKNLLAQLLSSPLSEKLNAALITAEAAVRIAGRKFGATGSIFTIAGDQRVAKPTDGSLWWMSRDLAEKKARYGRA